MTKKVVYSLPQLAKKLGYHRTTLKRMEDRGVIPKPPRITFPFKGRAYTEKMAAEVEKKLADYFSKITPTDGKYEIDLEETP
jgi:hypothetical protein